MEDHFAELNEPRRPWLDPAAVKARFLELSAAVHPDRFHTASENERAEANRRYARLNAAQTCLTDTKARLRHLLELERGARPEVVKNVPGETMDLFLRVGQLSRDVDAFIEEKESAQSPLLKARLFARGLEWTDQIQTLQAELNGQLAPLDVELKGLNAAWESAPEPGSPDRADALPLNRLEEIGRVVSHLTRWIAQLQERLVRLSF